jgi:hypothetical protein
MRITGGTYEICEFSRENYINPNRWSIKTEVLVVRNRSNRLARMDGVLNYKWAIYGYVTRGLQKGNLWRKYEI